LPDIPINADPGAVFPSPYFLEVVDGYLRSTSPHIGEVTHILSITSRNAPVRRELGSPAKIFVFFRFYRWTGDKFADSVRPANAVICETFPIYPTGPAISSELFLWVPSNPSRPTALVLCVHFINIARKFPAPELCHRRLAKPNHTDSLPTTFCTKQTF
jgi:hypothetical protein